MLRDHPLLTGILDVFGSKIDLYVRVDGSCISIGTCLRGLPLSRCIFGVVLWRAIYLVYCIGPVIDVVRANLEFTMGGGF